MSYPLSRLSHLYRKPGPWAFVQLDVGLDRRADVAEIPLLTTFVGAHAADLPYVVVEAARDGARVSAFRSEGQPVAAVDIEGGTVHITKVHGGGRIGGFSRPPKKCGGATRRKSKRWSSAIGPAPAPG